MGCRRIVDSERHIPSALAQEISLNSRRLSPFRVYPMESDLQFEGFLLPYESQKQCQTLGIGPGPEAPAREPLSPFSLARDDSCKRTESVTGLVAQRYRPLHRFASVHLRNGVRGFGGAHAVWHGGDRCLPACPGSTRPRVWQNRFGFTPPRPLPVANLDRNVRAVHGNGNGRGGQHELQRGQL